MYDNDLASLSDSVFDNLFNLEELYLAYNELTLLPNGVFDAVSNLKRLSLYSNELNSLPDGVFTGLSSLEFLEFDGNPGAPFLLEAELEQQGGDAVVVKIAEAAPFDLEVALTAQGGVLTTMAATAATVEVKVAAGTTTSEAVTVVPDEGQTEVTVIAQSSAFPSGIYGHRVSGIFGGIRLGVGASYVITPYTSQQQRTATGLPTISGTAQVGETLTANTSGIADADAVFQYQWITNNGTGDTDIPGATGSSYTLVEADEGRTIKARVSFTDDAGHEETLTSAATAAVAGAATEPGEPDHLNVSPHDEDALDLYWEAPASDGGSPITGYKVQWKAAADSWDTPEDVSEETVSGTTHTIHGLTEGVEYAVRVMASNEVGDGPASAEKTGIPRETGAPEMVRPRVDGATLRVLYDEALDEGSAPPADAFDVRVVCRCDDTKWQDEKARRVVDAVSVNGDTVALTLASAVTAEDSVVVSYTPPSDEASPRVQDAAGNPAAAIRPTQVFNDTEEANNPATGAPAISGTAQVGEMLTADTSGIADADGLDNAIFSYQWIAGGTGIAGATGSSYTLTASEEGQTVKVRVTFTDGTGNDESLTSDATGAVAAAPNRDATGTPTINGTAQVGETLTADTSAIADEDGLDNAIFSYQWIAGGTDIAGATGSSYTLTSSEEGQAIQVRVSFTDDADHDETLTSVATAAVAPRPPLAVSLVFSVASHHGASNVFAFDIRFSEEFPLSYETLKFHAFSVTGGEVLKAQRMDKPSNIPWRITVRPDSNGDVTIVLPVTTDCADDGAICTEDGRKLSTRLELTVSGPGQ